MQTRIAFVWQLRKESNLLTLVQSQVSASIDFGAILFGPTGGIRTHIFIQLPYSNFVGSVVTAGLFGSPRQDRTADLFHVKETLYH